MKKLDVLQEKQNSSHSEHLRSEISPKEYNEIFTQEEFDNIARELKSQFKKQRMCNTCKTISNFILNYIADNHLSIIAIVIALYSLLLQLKTG